MDDLKPCPFCGGGAKLWKAFPLSETPWCIDIEHVGDCFMVHADQMCRRTEADAIAAWNARATPTPDTAGLVERLCMNCRHYRDLFCQNPDAPYGGKIRLPVQFCHAFKGY